MQYSQEVENMCPVAKGAYHGPAPIPEEGKWVQAKEISDISGLTHGVGSVSYTHLRRNEHTYPPIVTGTKPGLFVPNPMQAEQTNLIIMSLI